MLFFWPKLQLITFVKIEISCFSGNYDTQEAMMIICRMSIVTICLVHFHYENMTRIPELFIVLWLFYCFVLSKWITFSLWVLQAYNVKF